MKLLGAIYFIIILVLPVSIHAQEEKWVIHTPRWRSELLLAEDR